MDNLWLSLACKYGYFGPLCAGCLGFKSLLALPTVYVVQIVRRLAAWAVYAESRSVGICTVATPLSGEGHDQGHTRAE